MTCNNINGYKISSTSTTFITTTGTWYNSSTQFNSTGYKFERGEFNPPPSSPLPSPKIFRPDTITHHSPAFLPRTPSFLTLWLGFSKDHFSLHPQKTSLLSSLFHKLVNKNRSGRKGETFERDSKSVIHPSIPVAQSFACVPFWFEALSFPYLFLVYY